MDSSLSGLCLMMRSQSRPCVWIALAVSLSGCPFEGNSIPETETCRSPRFSEVAQVRILAREGDDEWFDEQEAELIVGGQGVSMLPFRIEASGDELSRCMLLSIETQTVLGQPIGTWQRGVVMRETTAGVRQSGTIWYGSSGELQYPGFNLLIRMGGTSVERFLWSPGGSLPPIQPNLSLGSPEQVNLSEEFDLELSLDNLGPRNGLQVGIIGEASVFEAVDPQDLPSSCVGCLAIVSIPPRELRGTVRIRSLEARAETDISAFILSSDGIPPTDRQVTNSIEVRP